MINNTYLCNANEEGKKKERRRKEDIKGKEELYSKQGSRHKHKRGMYNYNTFIIKIIITCIQGYIQKQN